MSYQKRKRLVVAGASGFIGRALPAALGDRYALIGLSRNPEKAAARSGGSAYRWRKSDLFSRKQTRRALRGADLAVYLVHSLHPSARLTQGEVGDLDLICADNFARAARHHGVDHIVYVNRLAPSEAASSEYLGSRTEIAATLRSRGTPVTTLRTALVLGRGGIAATLLEKLVKRSPVMALPRWTESRLCPIALGDLVELIAEVLPRPALAGTSYAVGSAEATTFGQMLEMTADLTGRARRFTSIPVSAPRASVAWMSLWTGLPRRIVRPLVESLQHDLLPGERRLQSRLGHQAMTPARALEHALGERTGSLSVRGQTDEEETATLVAVPKEKEVRAVHRLTPPVDRSAAWVADEYRRWLPTYFGPFIDVEREEHEHLSFFLRPLPWPLLVLEFDHSVSTQMRQLYWIRGGLLARPHDDARLEFREVLGGRRVLAALHEFRPRLPWLLYLVTQARIHHWTMRAFDRHLRRLETESGDRRALEAHGDPGDVDSDEGDNR